MGIVQNKFAILVHFLDFVLHPEQSIDGELKRTNLLEFVRQNCIKMQQRKNAVRQVKG